MVLALWFFLTEGCAIGHQPIESKRALMEKYARDIRSNNLDSARAALLEGSRLYPSETVFWNDLAYLDFLRSDYTSAAKMLDKGLQADPDNQRLLLNKSRLYLAEGDIESAKQLLFRMLPRHPWIHGYRLLLAIVEVKDGNTEAGRILFEDLNDHHPGDSLIKSYLKKLKRSAK